MLRMAVVIFAGLALLGACKTPSHSSDALVDNPIPADTTGLDGTSWTLVEITSPDDKTGTVTPDDPSQYTMTLAADGKVAMKLNCNRGSGTWEAGSAGGNSGSFTFGPIITTKVFCKPPSLDQQIASDAEYVRSYVLEGDTLYLNLMADGGTYVWQKSPS